MGRAFGLRGMGCTYGEWGILRASVASKGAAHRCQSQNLNNYWGSWVTAHVPLLSLGRPDLTP